MIRAWLADKAGVAPLVERIATLEREAGETRATVASLNERIASADARAAAAAVAHDRQLRALVRVARAGTTRLRDLRAADLARAAHGETLRETLERMDAAIAVVETRIEAEAEQARRGTTGLFQAIEALREPRA